MTPPSSASANRDPRLVLDRVGRRCVQELDVEDVAIAVATGAGTWTPAHATSDTARELDQYAFAVVEGPCVDVLRDHSPVIEPDLGSAAAAARWPAWTRAAQAAGIGSVAAFPIQAGAVAAGALSIFFRTPRALDAQRFAAALRMTDLAFVGLLDLMAGLDHAADERDPDGDGSAGAMADLLRADVHWAAGMIMGQADVSIDEALARLRAHAYGSGRPLADAAADVVARRLRFEADGRSAQ